MSKAITVAEFKELTAPAKKKSGFDNAYGHWDSKPEFTRFLFLNDMQKKGVISGLERQIRFDFEHNGVYIGYYTCDFSFTIVATGQRIVEDVKPMNPKAHSNSRRDIPLRMKLMKAFYGIEVKIIKNMAVWPYSKI